jgi:hypothetical protein
MEGHALSTRAKQLQIPRYKFIRSEEPDWIIPRATFVNVSRATVIIFSIVQIQNI